MMTLDLTNAIVAGIPLMLVVIGLVQFVKEKLEWEGKGVEIFAIILGLIFGMVYWAYLGEPGDYVDWKFWFEAVVYGLAVGIVATGLYKAYHHENPKAEVEKNEGT